jgi:hypothetical protein
MLVVIVWRPVLSYGTLLGYHVLVPKAAGFSIWTPSSVAIVDVLLLAVISGEQREDIVMKYKIIIEREK